MSTIELMEEGIRGLRADRTDRTSPPSVLRPSDLPGQRIADLDARSRPFKEVNAISRRQRERGYQDHAAHDTWKISLEEYSTTGRTPL
jgi:hypothetical protein